MMKWIFDGILVLIMLFGLIRGYRCGLITLLFKRFRGFASIVLAFVFARPVSAMLNLNSHITTPVKDLLLEYVRGSAPAEMSDRVPTAIKSLAQLFEVDLTRYANEAAISGDNYIEAFVQSATEPLANALALAGAFLLIAGVSYVALWIAGKFINIVFKLPILKQLNVLVGAATGMFFFAVFAWCLCKLSVFAFDLIPDVALINEFDIQNTIIGKYLYNFNPMRFLLSL